jgi:G3E family GTPase
MQPRTPIMLITGSLGSGKTTLLKRILTAVDRRLVVLMNEFGEIAIDSQVVQGENVQVVELAGGCVCCSMTGEFEAAVKEVIETVEPEYIAVEATGVAEADALVYEVEDNLPEVRLDSVICIVDAYLTVKYPHMGYTTRTQLEAADVLLINKIDLVGGNEIDEVEEKVRHFNDSAFIFKTVGCDLDANLLLGLDAVRKASAGKRAGETEFQSFTYGTDALIDKGKFRQVMAQLPPSVYRAKGFVCFEGGRFLLNYVAGRVDLEEFPAERTQLVFIGRDIVKDKDSIFKRLRVCEVRYAL